VNGAPASIAGGRTPELVDLVRGPDLSRSLKGFVAEAVDGVAVFTARGAPHAIAASEASPLSRWGQLPAEATHALRRGDASFGLLGHRFDVRPLYAGAERVGALVVSRRADADPQGEVPARTDAIAGLLGHVHREGRISRAA